MESSVLDLKIKLEKSLESSGNIDTSGIHDMLLALSALLMTYEVLKATKIGRVTNLIGKNKSFDPVIRKLAADTTEKWKTLVPALQSARVSSRPKEPKNYKEPTEAEIIAQASETQTNQVMKMAAASGSVKIKKETKDPPARDQSGSYIFPDYPNFRPNLSPKEVLLAGSFGGSYFRPITSKVTGKSYGREVYEELPKDWLEGLSASDIKRKIASPVYNNDVNKYRVKCGATLDEWESSGWMRDCDPYGWFQWYSRFFQGRRCDDDERQVARGLSCFGPTGRWRTNLMNKIIAAKTGKKGLEDVLHDAKISPVIRQTLQHWGYRVTLKDLEAHIKSKFG